jgi:hypothetical protein
MFHCRFCFGFLALVFAMGLCLSADVDAAAPKKPKKPKTPRPPQVAPNQFNVPATALPANTTPTTPDGTTKGDTAKGGSDTTKTVDKEADYDIAGDAKIQKLHKFATGLNFIEAEIDDLMEGQKVTLSLVTKAGDKKDVTHVSGTVAKIAEGGKKVTLTMSVREKDDVPSGDGKQATLVSIRSLEKDKDTK